MNIVDEYWCGHVASILQRHLLALKESEDESGEIFEFRPGKVGESFGYERINGGEEGKVLFEV